MRVDGTDGGGLPSRLRCATAGGVALLARTLVGVEAFAWCVNVYVYVCGLSRRFLVDSNLVK